MVNYKKFFLSLLIIGMVLVSCFILVKPLTARAKTILAPAAIGNNSVSIKKIKTKTTNVNDILANNNEFLGGLARIDATSTKLGIQAIIKEAADKLLSNQNTDGGWDLVLGDKDKTSSSLLGFTGAAALGLLRAKDAFQDRETSYLNAAIKAGDFLYNKSNASLSAPDIIFLYYLYEETATTKYLTKAQNAIATATTDYETLSVTGEDQTRLGDLANLIEAGKLIYSDQQYSDSDRQWIDYLMADILDASNDNYDSNTGAFIYNDPNISYLDSNSYSRLMCQAKMVEVLAKYYDSNYPEQLADAREFLLACQDTTGKISWAANVDANSITPDIDTFVQDQAAGLSALSYYNSDLSNSDDDKGTYLAASALKTVLDAYIDDPNAISLYVGDAVVALSTLLPRIEFLDTACKEITLYQDETEYCTYEIDKINDLLGYDANDVVGFSTSLTSATGSTGWITFTDPNVEIAPTALIPEGVYTYTLSAINMYGKASKKSVINVLQSLATERPLGTIKDITGCALDPNSFCLTITDSSNVAYSIATEELVYDGTTGVFSVAADANIAFPFGTCDVAFSDNNTSDGIYYKDMEFEQEFSRDGYVKIVAKEILVAEETLPNYINVSVKGAETSKVYIDIFDPTDNEMVYSFSMKILDPTDPNSTTPKNFIVDEKKVYLVTAKNINNYASHEMTDPNDACIAFDFNDPNNDTGVVAKVETVTADPNGVEIDITGDQLATSTTITIKNVAVPTFSTDPNQTDTIDVDIVFEAKYISLDAFVSEDSNTPVSLDANSSITLDIDYSVPASSDDVAAYDSNTGIDQGCTVVKIEFKDDTTGEILKYNPSESSDVQAITFMVPLHADLQNPDLSLSEVNSMIMKNSDDIEDPNMYGIYYIPSGETNPEVFIAEIAGESIEVEDSATGFRFAKIKTKHLSQWYVQLSSSVNPPPVTPTTKKSKEDDDHWYECFIGSIL